MEICESITTLQVLFNWSKLFFLSTNIHTLYLSSLVYDIIYALKALKRQQCSTPNTYIDTMIADGAVGAAWWSIKLTGGAPLHAHRDPVDFCNLEERCTKIIVLLCFIFGRCKNEKSTNFDIGRESHENSFHKNNSYIKTALQKKKQNSTDWKNSRIHECRSAKIDDDKNGEKAVYNRDRITVVLREVTATVERRRDVEIVIEILI